MRFSQRETVNIVCEKAHFGGLVMRMKTTVNKSEGESGGQ